MGRSNTASAGHNSGEPLTDDDVAALVAFYGQKVRIGRLEVEKAATALKLARTQVNGQFKLVAKDLKFTRLEFEDLLAKQDMGEKAFLESEAKRTARYALAGLPVGAQLDMFPATTGDTADDKANAYEDGRLAGLYGKDRDVPGKIAAVFHTDWLSGFNAGAEQLAGMMERAGALIAARAAAPVPGELAEEPEYEGDDLDPDTITKKARALKKGGFMDPTPEETGFSETPVEQAA